MARTPPISSDDFSSTVERVRQMEAIALLAGGVAHEFNNLLMVIKGFTELAMLHRSDPDRLQADLEHIRTAAHRAGEITSQLLSLSRRIRQPPQRVLLAPLVTETARLLRPLLGEQVALTVDILAPDAAAMLDPGEVQQALLNLVINSRDAMNGAGPLRIALTEEGDEIVLAVSDEGSGMDAETLARATEPFFTTKAVGSGTGLGLPTVADLARSWGGALLLESTPGEGTTATLRLPGLSASTPDTAEAPPAPALSASTAAILVVEDDDAVRLMLGEALADLGTVRTAAEATEALALLEQQPADLLVVDVVLPGMSGPDLVRALAERGQTPPVIYFSGHPRQKVRAWLPEGATFLRKPVSIQALSEAVQAALAGG